LGGRSGAAPAASDECDFDIAASGFRFLSSQNGWESGCSGNKSARF
jgi:hypothetical protein